MREIELLAPAGGWEAMVAAVQNGADAIYLGGTVFSARQSANNFNEEELIKAVEYCHIRGVKVFVTINTLVSNEELEKLGEYVAFLYNHDVDAVIVQDLGAAKLIRDLFPDMAIHASTQMSVHNTDGVKLLEDLGFHRVVLAREMSVEEIKRVQESTKLDIEVFVHGALCICYSGQCLMSSIIGGRSGNRGRCAQPCRMTYQLIDMKSGKEVRSEEGDYLLSPRDLNTLENIHQILDTGVKSLKIEGRLKRPEYVATVVGAYRRAIDQYLQNRSELEIDARIKKDVEQIFNRKFTKGYILGDYGKEIMSFAKPSNRGIKVGEVVAYDKSKNRVEIKLVDELWKGDGIEIWTDKGDSPGAIVEVLLVKGQKREQGKENEIVQVNFRHSVLKGQAVYKTSDIHLFQRAKESYERTERRIPIYGAFKGKLGENISLSLWDGEGHHVQQEGTYLVEKATHRPTEENRVREQLGKLGNTPYVFEELNIQLDEEGIIPIGELNALRRDAVEKLNILRTTHNERQKIEAEGLKKQLKDWFAQDRQEYRDPVRIRVSVHNLAQLKAVMDYDVDRIYYTDMETFEEALGLLNGSTIEIVPSSSRITSDDEIIELKRTYKGDYDVNGLMVANLGTLKMANVMGMEKIYGDFTLNVFNNGAIRLLQDMGLAEVTLSPELTLKQVKEILQDASIPCEIIVHGYLPLMVMKYCPASAVLSRKGEQENCKLCRNSNLGLKDRKGMIFPVMTDRYCRTHILNSQELCVIEHIHDMIDAGVTNLRIQFTIEDQVEVGDTMKAYFETINDGKLSPASEKFLQKLRERGITKGHFYRGVQ